MNFYYLVVEQYDGFRYPVRNSFSNTENDVQKYLENFKKDLYKSIEIKNVSATIEDIIVSLVRENNGHLSPSFYDLLIPEEK